MFQIKDLCFSYKKKTVFENLSFSIMPNRIVGILGSNGAGKTTLIECLEGIKTPQKGEITFGGKKVDKGFRNSISIQFQDASFFYKLKVREIFDLATGLLGYREDFRILLSEFDLLDSIDKYYEHLSGGMKQKVAVAVAVMNKGADIVFLDEPTAGLDLFSRKNLWKTIRGLKASGKMVILTTHLIEEAEALCDDIIIIDKGRIIAHDAPDALSRKHCRDMEFIVELTEELDAQALTAEHQFVHNIKRTHPQDYNYRVLCRNDEDGTGVVNSLVSYFMKKKHTISGFSVRKNNLETAFFNIIGYRIDETGDAVT